MWDCIKDHTHFLLKPFPTSMSQTYSKLRRQRQAHKIPVPIATAWGAWGLVRRQIRKQ